MALEQCFEDMTREYGLNEDEVPLRSWNCNSCGHGVFDCNICLDSVKDPVVTLCGHLYCWPCIYKWICHQSKADHQEPRCPVCKARVSHETLVPLYGRFGSTNSYHEKGVKFDAVVPNRPRSPRWCIASQMAAQSHPYPGGYMASPMLNMSGVGTNVTHPVVGMFGEMVYERIFGNSETNFLTYPNSYSLAGAATPRVRRYIMEVDRSLNRLCFFMFCCMLLCLILF